MNFFVKAVWDEEAKVFYSDSDIVGLHIEAETIEGFRETARGRRTRADPRESRLERRPAHEAVEGAGPGYLERNGCRATSTSKSLTPFANKGSHGFGGASARTRYGPEPTRGPRSRYPGKLRSRHTANRILKDAGCVDRV